MTDKTKDYRACAIHTLGLIEREAEAGDRISTATGIQLAGVQALISIAESLNNRGLVAEGIEMMEGLLGQAAYSSSSMTDDSFHPQVEAWIKKAKGAGS